MKIAVTYENGEIFSTLDTQKHSRSMTLQMARL